MLNTAVANQLKIFIKNVEKLQKKGFKKDEAILQTIRQTIIESKNVRFEGNGYSQEWIQEAEKRNLTNVKDVIKALSAYKSSKAVKLFVENKIFTEKEINARFEVLIEKYKKQLQIESRVLGDIVLNHIVPAVIKYQNILIENVRGMKEIFEPNEWEKLTFERMQIIREISEFITLIKQKNEKMRQERKAANSQAFCLDVAKAYSNKVKPYFEEIRFYIDK